MKKIKIAFIGAGNTMNEYLKVVKKGSDVPVELSGIFSRTKRFLAFTYNNDMAIVVPKYKKKISPIKARKQGLI